MTTKRYYLQYSLSSFLLGLFLIAVFVGRALLQERQQTAAMAALCAAGGNVYYDDSDDPVSWTVTGDLEDGVKPHRQSRFPEWAHMRSVETIDLMGVALNKATLSDLAELRHARKLYLSYTSFTDADSEILRLFDKLEFLSLSNTGITDESIGILSNIVSLRKLYVNFTAISDEHLDRLAACPRITELSLCSTLVAGNTMRKLCVMKHLTALSVRDNAGITDSAFLGVSGFESLEMIDLVGTAVTDESLDVISRFPRLQVVHVSDGTITMSGIQKLRAKLPQLDVKVFKTPR